MRAFYYFMESSRGALRQAQGRLRAMAISRSVSPIRQAACKQLGDSRGVRAEADLDVRSPSPTPIKICHRRPGSEFAACFDINRKVAGCEQVRLDDIGHADHIV